MEPIYKYLTLRNFAAFVLVLFCIRYIPLESRASISFIKTGVSAICCIVFITKTPYATKALIISIIYFLSILFSAIFHMETFRASTLLYLCSFLITFITMYNLVYVKKIFSLEFFIKLIKNLIFAYAIVLFIQQAFLIVGIKFFPPINLCQILNRGIGANSLSGEPSTAARIMGVLLYAYMECVSFRENSTFRFKQLFEQEHKWVTIGFLWSMLTMGSGTAFIVLGVLSLYFINWRNALIVIPLLGGLIYIGSLMGIEQFDRAYNTTQATLSMDKEAVVETDGSAYMRIAPMLNTIKNLDLSKKEHWFGYGVDKGLANKNERMIGEITDYGFLAYILGLVLVFSCSIRFLSIPTIMFFIGIGGGTGNIAYFWGILIVFMCVRYFHNDHNKNYNICI